MTKDEHRAEHRLLHGQLGRLIRDFTFHTEKLVKEAYLTDLTNWSFRQTLDPTDISEEVQDENP